MRRLLVALAVLLGATPAQAEAPAVTRHVLPNGLRVLVREAIAAPVVAVSLQATGGSRLETEATAGITNLLQRTLIRGTKHRSAVQIAEALEEIGGTVDASGAVESAEIRGQALARHWEALLEIVAEIVVEPALAPGEVDRERRLVLSQIRTRADTPFPAALDALLRELHGAHPYAWPSQGTVPSVRGLTRERLLAHYREVYRPERMVLAVSGQVTAERVTRAAARLFGKLPRTAGASLAAGPSPAPSGARRVLVRAAQQAQVLVGYLGPGLREPDYPALRVLGAALGGGMAGRLYTEIRARRGLAYLVGVLTPFREGPAFFVAYLGTAPGTASTAEQAMLREIDRVRTEGLRDDEVERARAHVLGGLALDRRTNARQAWYLAFFEAVGAGWDFPDRYARALEAVTARDVQRAAERYLATPTIVLLQPGGA
jgi:predicted Zn-dependent peptidase